MKYFQPGGGEYHPHPSNHLGTTPQFPTNALHFQFTLISISLNLSDYFINDGYLALKVIHLTQQHCSILQR